MEVSACLPDQEWSVYASCVNRFMGVFPDQEFCIRNLGYGSPAPQFWTDCPGMPSALKCFKTVLELATASAMGYSILRFRDFGIVNQPSRCTFIYALEK